METQTEIIKKNKNIIEFCKDCNKPISVKGIEYPKGLILEEVNWGIKLSKGFCRRCFEKQRGKD